MATFGDACGGETGGRDGLSSTQWAGFGRGFDQASAYLTHDEFLPISEHQDKSFTKLTEAKDLFNNAFSSLTVVFQHPIR